MNADKVKDLAERILEECRQQGLTVAEVRELVNELGNAVYFREEEVVKENSF